MASDVEQVFYTDNTQLRRALGDGFDWEGYVERTRPDTERRERLLARYVTASDRLLDVGCGYGFLLSRIANRVKEAIGIEPGKVRRDFGRTKLGADIRQPPLASAGIASESVDVACIFQVLEHIVTPGPFLAEIREALKPGGLLVVEVPNFADIYVRLIPAYRAYHFQSAHALYYTPGTLRHVINRAGFTVVAVRGVQRYAFANALHWALHRAPQRIDPSRTVRGGAAAFLDHVYRSLLSASRLSDTLVCLARKPS
jgi:SAM-dependent methyltransferase